MTFFAGASSFTSRRHSLPPFLLVLVLLVLSLLLPSSLSQPLNNDEDEHLLPLDRELQYQHLEAAPQQDLDLDLEPEPHEPLQEEDEPQDPLLLSPLPEPVLSLQQLQQPSGPRREAYVSMLTNDNYVYGGRALGASIRRSGSTKDMVMVVTDGVSEKNRDLLRGDGWLVRPVDIIPNPYFAREEDAPSFTIWSTFTKFAIWNITEYDKLIFLDADVVVLKNLDPLFNCGKGMCAQIGKAYPSLFNFNAGVMVITPSEAILNDLLASAKRLGHNGKSEAGLMNKYFMHYCVNEGKLPGTLPALRSQSKPFHPPTFDENKLEEMRDLWCVTLPKAYNWRWGQWVHQLIGNETKLEPYNKNIQIVHFNGAFKPWQWRLYPFHGWFGYWHAFTGDLSPGIFREDNLQQIPTLLFPLLVFGFIYFLSQQEWGLPRFSHWFAANFLSRVPFFGTPSSFRYTPASRWQRRSIWEQVKRGIRWIPIVGPLLFFIFGNRNRGSGRRHYSPNNSLFSSLLCIAFASYCLLYPHYYLWAEDKELIPPYLSPFFGWFLHLEWSLFLFWVPFSLYCYYFYLVGILLPSSPASDFATRHKEKEEDITMEDDPFLSSSSSSSVPEQVDEETGPTRASSATPILSTPTPFMQHPLRQFKAKEAFQKYFWLEQSGLLANCACNSLAILSLNVATLWIELYFFGFTNAVSRSMLLYVAGFFHVIYVMLWVESVPLLFFLQGKKDRRPELLSFFAKKHRS